MDELQCLNTTNNVKNHNNTPLNISFKNICYTVRCKRKKIVNNILTNASGNFISGRLVGILGPSGAGKTTLLSILAGFKSTGVTGDVLINGKPRNLDDFRWQSCCISQDSAMLPLLTGHETMMTAANLKLPAHIPFHQKEKIVSDIADILNLKKIMNTRVSEVSGGELKRLSIGVELVTNPPVMFFDEPTSGLDSVSSCQVISHLRSLARGGRTVVCVIHQPSSKIFDMFDDMCLVSNGTIIYGGPTSEIIPVFESAGFQCPQYYNRADFALEVASHEIEGDIDSLVKMSNAKNLEIHSLTSNFDGNIPSESVPVSSEKHTPLFWNTTAVDKKCAASFSIEDIKIECRKTFAISQWRQFLILLKRSIVCTFRDVFLTRMKVLVHVLAATILGLLYYQIGNEASMITTNTAYLFIILVFLFFVNAMIAVIKFPAEAAVFQREHLNNWYSVSAYYFSKLFADVPLQLICPTIFLLICYLMSGQPLEFNRIAVFWVVCVIFSVIAQLVGLVSGVIFNAELGLFLMPALTIPMVIFSGFFIRYEEIPVYLRFMSYISYYGYAFHGMLQSVYGNDRPDLHCSQVFCFYKKPSKYLKEIDMLKGSYIVDIGCLLGFMLFMQISLYATLKYRVWRLR